MDKIEEVIAKTVNETVLKLKIAGLMKDSNKTAFEKTEEILRNYNALKLSDQPETIKTVKMIRNALKLIEADDYYPIITMTYFEQHTREQIAEYLDTSVTTVSRNKTRLVNKLKAVLFSDDFIYELYS